METKQCTSCGELKPLAEFHRHTQNGGVRPRCKACRKAQRNPLDYVAYNKTYYAAHREKMLAAGRAYQVANADKLAAHNKRWREENHESLKSKRMQRTYGITLEQWREIFASQGHACRICQSTDPKNKRGWQTDHGVTVRGILCLHCNTGLGAFNHDIRVLKRAIAYLER